MEFGFMFLAIATVTIVFGAPIALFLSSFFEK